MDDNSNKVRPCGQIGEGEDDEVSLEEILKEQARLQADADAVLGGSDPHNCTFPKGYLKRQAVYACKTCTPGGNAGICLACSYACHEGHELHELYTKRFFCCDCGNDKFSGKECKLAKDKKMNSRNRYNHNFKGLYCTCFRPYPDPEDSTDDEMIQCIMCEDWLHGRHLDTTLPEDFYEMICPECMSKFPFLWSYQVVSQSDVTKVENSDADSGVDVESEKTNEKTKGNCLKDEANSAVKAGKAELKEVKPQGPSDDSCEGMSKVTTSCEVGVKRERDTTGEEEHPIKCKIPKQDLSEADNTEDGAEKRECLLKSLQMRDCEVFEHASFWPLGWRSKLCKCEDCMEMYKDKNVEFLVDESDTMLAYEEAGDKEDVRMIEEAEHEMFAGTGMHRVTQIEIARGVRDMKADLSEFLQGFAREGKVVTEMDIREFFRSLEEKRRRRMNLPQDNCR